MRRVAESKPWYGWAARPHSDDDLTREEEKQLPEKIVAHGDAVIRYFNNRAPMTRCDRDDHLVQAAFERKEDADRVDKALLARRSGGYPGWASQRTFEFGATSARKSSKCSRAGSGAGLRWQVEPPCITLD
jgi:hypothetical protein